MSTTDQQTDAARQLSGLWAEFNEDLAILRRDRAIADGDRPNHIRRSYSTYLERHNELVAQLTGKATTDTEGQPPLTLNDVIRGARDSQRAEGAIQLFLRPPAPPEELRGTR